MSSTLKFMHALPRAHALLCCCVAGDDDKKQQPHENKREVRRAHRCDAEAEAGDNAPVADFSGGAAAGRGCR